MELPKGHEANKERNASDSDRDVLELDTDINAAELANEYGNL